MSKQKIKLYITPYEDINKLPVDITTLSDLLDILSGKFEIVSIEIQINEYNKPSEFYFDILSRLCKTISNSVVTNHYTGKKANNIFKVDSFSYMNIIINNSNDPFVVIYENQKKKFQTKEDFTTVLSVL